LVIVLVSFAAAAAAAAAADAPAAVVESRVSMADRFVDMEEGGVVFQPLTWIKKDDWSKNRRNKTTASSFSSSNLKQSGTGVDPELVIHARGRDCNGRIVQANIRNFQPFFHIKCCTSLSNLKLIAKNRKLNSVRIQSLKNSGHCDPNQTCDCFPRSFRGFFPTIDLDDDLLSVGNNEQGLNKKKLENNDDCDHDRDEENFEDDEFEQSLWNDSDNYEFYRITCPSLFAYFKSRSLFSQQKRNVEMFDSTLDVLMQFMIAKSISPLSWIRACRISPPQNNNNNNKNHSGENKTRRTDGMFFEFDVDVDDIEFSPPSPKQPPFAPFMCGFFDLECFSSIAYEKGENKMPNPDIDRDVIIGIGIVLTRMDHVVVKSCYFGIKSCFQKNDVAESDDHEEKDELKEKKNEDGKKDEKMGQCSSDDRDEFFWFENEKNMLESFVKFCSSWNFDFWIGFNNQGFDDRYLWKRFSKNNVELNETFFSRSELASLTFNSTALQYHINFLKFPHVVNYDLLTFARKEWKSQMTQFSLNAVSRVILGEQKHDVSPRFIFEAFAEMNSKKLDVVGRYCLQDCKLVMRLSERKAILNTLLSRSELFLINPDSILTSGQTKIVFHLINQEIRGKGKFLIPDRRQSTFRANPVSLVNGKRKHEEDEEEDEEEDGEEEEEEEEEQTPKRKLDHQKKRLAIDKIGPKVRGKKQKQTEKPKRPEQLPTTKDKFQGATVLEPVKGFHSDPVAALDFASLYPSIMRAFNMCHSSFCGNITGDDNFSFDGSKREKRTGGGGGGGGSGGGVNHVIDWSRMSCPSKRKILSNMTSFSQDEKKISSLDGFGFFPDEGFAVVKLNRLVDPDDDDDDDPDDVDDGKRKKKKKFVPKRRKKETETSFFFLLMMSFLREYSRKFSLI